MLFLAISPSPSSDAPVEKHWSQTLCRLMMQEGFICWYVSSDFFSKESIKEKDNQRLHLFLHLRRFQRSNTSAPAPFTPRSPATGATSLPSSTTRSKRSCFLRSLASPPALRSSWPACAWRWRPSPSTWCPRRGQGRVRDGAHVSEEGGEVDGRARCLALLELLTVLPEEFQTSRLPQYRKGQVRGALGRVDGRYPLLQQLLRQPDSPPLVKARVLKCLSSWVCWMFLWTRARDWSRPVSRRWRIRSCSIRLWRPLSTPSHSPTHRVSI